MSSLCDSVTLSLCGQQMVYYLSRLASIWAEIILHPFGQKGMSQKKKILGQGLVGLGLEPKKQLFDKLFTLKLKLKPKIGKKN